MYDIEEKSLPFGRVSRTSRTEDGHAYSKCRSRFGGCGQRRRTPVKSNPWVIGEIRGKTV